MRYDFCRLLTLVKIWTPSISLRLQSKNFTVVEAVWSKSRYFSEPTTWSQSILLLDWGFLFHLLPAMTFCSTCKHLFKSTFLMRSTFPSPFTIIVNFLALLGPHLSFVGLFRCLLSTIFCFMYDCVTSLYIDHIPVTPWLSQLNVISIRIGIRDLCQSYVCLFDLHTQTLTWILH